MVVDTCPLGNDTYSAGVSQDDLISVALTQSEWSIVQEALDNYFYEIEHRASGGIRRTTRQRLADRREELLSTLPRLDVTIAKQAGVGPLFGE